MLLVDGDHGYRGALQDIRNMRALAKPGAVLLVDDLDEGPGPALRQAQAEGLVEILDIRMFNASTVADEVNPCLRTLRPGPHVELQEDLGMGGRALSIDAKLGCLSY